MFFFFATDSFKGSRPDNLAPPRTAYVKTLKTVLSSGQLPWAAFYLKYRGKPSSTIEKQKSGLATKIPLLGLRVFSAPPQRMPQVCQALQVPQNYTLVCIRTNLSPPLSRLCVKFMCQLDCHRHTPRTQSIETLCLRCPWLDLPTELTSFPITAQTVLKKKDHFHLLMGARELTLRDTLLIGALLCAPSKSTAKQERHSNWARCLSIGSQQWTASCCTPDSRLNLRQGSTGVSVLASIDKGLVKTSTQWLIKLSALKATSRP